MWNNLKKQTRFLLGLLVILFLGACSAGQENQPAVDLQAVFQKVKTELGEDYYPNREMEWEEIEAYTDLSKGDVENYLAEAPLISTQVDTFIAVEGKAGKGDKIAEGLEKYRTYLVEQSMQYPMNMPKVQAAKVVQHGDYVFFIMLGKMNEGMEDAGSAEALEFAQKETERVEKVIDSFFE